MDLRKFLLSYYTDATENFHIKKITQPRGALSLHTHDYFQIYYLKSGRIVHHHEGGEAELHPGDFFIIPPNLPHYIETSSEQILFYSISFTQPFLAGIADTNKFIADFIHYITEADSKAIAPAISLKGDDAGLADSLVLKIMSEFHSQSTAKENVIRSSVGLILTLFARCYFDEGGESIRPRSDRDAIEHCLVYIKNHLAEDISLTEMARKTAMSRTVFCSTFKRVTGETFKGYLNRIRIEKAITLLRSGESVECTARMCGFSDPSTFYRNFKKRTGVAPGKMS